MSVHRQFSNHVWFHRQNGGCFEIGQMEPNIATPDIVHICEDEIGEFMDQLITFVKETDKKEGVK